jgi:hypothetical protein
MSRTYRQKPHKGLRHPHSTNERRAIFASIDEGVPVRAKRGNRHLPDNYDDKPFASPKEIWRGDK